MPRIGPLRTTKVPPALGLLPCAMASRVPAPSRGNPASPRLPATPAFRQSRRDRSSRCACVLRCAVLMVLPPQYKALSGGLSITISWIKASLGWHGAGSPLQVVGEVEGVERSVVVVRVTVTAGIPRDNGEMRGKGGELVVPVGAIAADAMHKDEQRTGALLVHSSAERASNVLGRPGCRRGCGSHAYLRLLASWLIVVGRWPLFLLSADSSEGASNSRAEFPPDGLIHI